MPQLAPMNWIFLELLFWTLVFFITILFWWNNHKKYNVFSSMKTKQMKDIWSW